MAERAYRISSRITVVFGPTPVHDVEIRQYGNRGKTYKSITLTADDWDAIVDRSPYMPILAERYPPGM